MFRWIRRKLREIEYHSASRPRTIWARATDAMLVLTLVLAPLITWMCDRLVMSRQIFDHIEGILAIEADRSFHAFIFDHSEPDEDFWQHASQRGEWRVNRIREQRGFPFPTTTRRAAPQLLLNDYTKPNGLKTVEPNQNHAPHAAIMTAMERNGFEEVSRGLSGSGGSGRAHRLSWVIGSAVWWLMLACFGFVMIQLTRVGFGAVWIRRMQQRLQRRRAGLCVHCGYDLHGLEFNERCPECGHLVE